MKALYTLPAICLLLLCVSGCTKMETNGDIPKPGIALTFDDNYINEWIEIMPLLDSFHAKATFYISNFRQLGKEQLKNLKEIQKRGHEIAYHSLNHCNMIDYLKNSTMEKLIKSEILDGLQKMKAEGFNPVTFAYPYGKHNELLDQELLKHFKSVRALNGTNNFAKSMATGFNNRVLYGLGIDESSKRSMGTLLQLVHNAKEGNACLVLVAHHVTRTDVSMHLPTYKLRQILQEAKSTGLHFYTVAEISN